MTKLTTVHFASTGRLANTYVIWPVIVIHCAKFKCNSLAYNFDQDLNDSQIYLHSLPGTKGVQENCLLRKNFPKNPHPFTDEL